MTKYAATAEPVTVRDNHVRITIWTEDHGNAVTADIHINNWNSPSRNEMVRAAVAKMVRNSDVRIVAVTGVWSAGDLMYELCG
jgi:hypothetical protein